MSETTDFHDAASSRGDDAAGSAQAAGAMLRQAREDAGLHVAAMAAALKVTVKKLEALEAGRIDLLPDATFARGLAASICRGLKIDPKPVLDLMPGIGGSRLWAAPPAINERFEPGGTSAAATLRGRPTPAMWAVLLLLLGALVIYLLPDRISTPAEESSSGVPSATQMAAPGTVTETVVSAEPMPAAEPQPAVSAPVVAASAAPAADAVLLFIAKSESWVQVTDARGQVPLRRSLQAGERVSAGGALPLSVVVGRIDAVDVQVRGQGMDLRGIAKNNVARFEVK